MPMQFIIHMDFLYQEKCAQQILKTAVTITTAEHLQISVERKEKLVPCNNYNGVNCLK